MGLSSGYMAARDPAAEMDPRSPINPSITIGNVEPGTRPSPARHWAFTGFDTDGPAPEVRLLGLYDYLVYGLEVAPETGKKHWQGYVVLTTKLRLSPLKKQSSSDTWHWEIARSAPAVNRSYCVKDGDYREFGTIPLTVHQARDERLADMRDLARQGKIEEIGDKYPSEYIRHIFAFEHIARRNLVFPPDADDVTGIWIQGKPGSGKSSYARATYPDFYSKLPNKWWCGYNNQPHVIIDDLSKSHEMLGYHIKIWTDRYAFPAEIKGGMTGIRPKFVIITSNYTVDAIFSDPATREAIKRRCKLIDQGGADDRRAEDIKESYKGDYNGFV